MGKAKKQRHNRLAKQIRNNEHEKDFLEMIEAMKDEKPYQIKKGNGYLFDGANFMGSVWKQMFLKPGLEVVSNSQ